MNNKTESSFKENKFFQMVKENYDIEITNAEIMCDHTYSKTYLLLSQTDKYVLKEIGSDYYNLESEGLITEYLSENSILVSKFLRTKNGIFSVVNGENSYSLQNFAELTAEFENGGIK